MRIEIVTEDHLGAQAAARVSSVLRDAVRRRGRATVAFSGGAGAASLFAGLVDAEVPWSSVDVLQVDERIAPPGHAERNLTGLRTWLLAKVPIPPEQVHPMPVEEPDLAAGAERYAACLRALTGPEPTLDLVHLGIGADGHTASLAPGSPLLAADAPPVAVTPPFRGWRRMTMTPPVLSGAREVLWLVGGAEKAAVVRRIVDGDRSLPAANLTAASAWLLLDTAAAARLVPVPTTTDTDHT